MDILEDVTVAAIITAVIVVCADILFGLREVSVFFSELIDNPLILVIGLFFMFLLLVFRMAEDL